MSFSRERYASITSHTGGLRPKPKGGDMPHSKIKIWICFGLVLLGCIYPSYPQVRPPPAKPAGKSYKSFPEPLPPYVKEGDLLFQGIKRFEPLGKGAEYFSPGKKWDGGQSARAPKALNLTKESAPSRPYAKGWKKISVRYKHDVEFKRGFDQLSARVIEQGLDKAVIEILRKHLMLDEHSSVQFVANQSDKDSDESYMKKIAKKVLYIAVHNVLPFEFQTESDCKSALKDAVKKACDELNRGEKPLPWALKFEPESDDLVFLVFQSRDDKHPDAKLPIGAILSDLANLTNYESIQTAPSDPRG
jgi:hypothetical protein